MFENYIPSNDRKELYCLQSLLFKEFLRTVDISVTLKQTKIAFFYHKKTSYSIKCKFGKVFN